MPVKVSPDIVTHLGIKSSLAENQWSVIIQVRDDGDLSHGRAGEVTSGPILDLFGG